ncbi:flagella assembly protein FlgT middle domain-containing protein [Caballeronia sp. dw_19]|uniref:flagella assembly protein FlgT middle domain-containing protein n=1 Tax=Caballeronia sp. dw_19 TaxID=2719791 RepID=UPI001BD62159
MPTWLSMVANASMIEVQGSSRIDDRGAEVARTLAVADARDAAALAISSRLESTELRSPGGALVRSGRIRGQDDIGDIRVTKEWQSDGVEHIVATSDNSLNAPHRPNRRYKRKVATTRFAILSSTQADDIDDLVDGLASQLARGLDDDGGFLAESSRASPFYRDGHMLTEPDPASIREIAYRSNSQFVLSGRVLNVSIESGLFGMLEARKRQVDIELFVSDGLTGGSIAHHQFSALARGDVVVGLDKPFGSAAFYDTPLGKTISAALAAFKADVARDVTALPFAAHIVHVDDWRVTIDAGVTSSIAPGDTLLVYHRMPGWLGSLSGGYSTQEEELVGSVTVDHVQPLTATGTLIAGTAAGPVAAGDFVRFADDH